MKKIKNTSKKFLSNMKQIKNIKIDLNILIKKLQNQTISSLEKITNKKLLKNLKPNILIETLQDKLKGLITVNNDQVILKQSRFWASAITWVLMGGTAFAVGWIAVAKTDEIVIAMGKLEPKGGVIDVQMPLEGIAKEILVKEGEIVKKNQILIKLDTEITNTKNAALKKKLELNQIIVNKLKDLVKEGAVSELQYIQQKAKVEEIKSQINTNLVMLKYQTIISPIDGIVFELQPKSVGYVAKSSQPVLKIVPIDNLLAKVEIDSRTIGFVSKGQHVDISIDSFPASDFGVIEGTLERIGSDALPPSPSEGKGYRFPADVSLKTQYLKVKSGKKLPLQTGMSLTANIKLRKVTYLQLLLNKFGDKTNSLKSI